MPMVSVLDMAGKQVSEIQLNDAIFGIEPNKSALHIMVRSYLANQRQGTQSTLTRAEVSGGGRKPWKQKGTGHARQGSTRSPQWTHGGIAHGPKPREYGISVNKKVKKLAMQSALSSKVLENKLIVLDSLSLSEIKTKEMVKVLGSVDAGKKAMIVLPEKNDTVYKSARNIPGTTVAFINTMNVYDILNATAVIVVKDAVAKIEEVYA